MPDRCSGYGEDQSPDLKVEGVPEGTVTLAVIMDDLDHPVVLEYTRESAEGHPRDLGQLLIRRADDKAVAVAPVVDHGFAGAGLLLWKKKRLL